jgi:hypothetical protein
MLSIIAFLLLPPILTIAARLDAGATASRAWYLEYTSGDEHTNG